MHRRAEHHREIRFARVKLLEEAASEHAMVDHGALQKEARQPGGIDVSVPDAVAKRVEIFRMFSDQDCFRFAIARLVPEIGARSGTAVMPDTAGRRKADSVTLFQQAPADIHVVAGFANYRIESVNLVQRPFVKGQVAAWDMFCLPVGEHDVGGTTRSRKHGGSHGRVFRRQEIMSTDADEIGAQQVVDEIVKPILVRPAVRVSEGHDFAAGHRNAGIARGR